MPYKDERSEQARATRKAYKLSAIGIEKRKICDLKNLEHNNAAKKLWAKNNPDKVKKSRKDWQINNKEHLKWYVMNKKSNDPLFKLTQTLRHRVGLAFKRGGWYKNGPTELLIGCSYREAMLYLERLFLDGMTWENHGKWHIDHIIPLSLAKTQEELRGLCRIENMQPLWAVDNLKKWKKIREDFPVDALPKYLATRESSLSIIDKVNAGIL